MKKLKTPALIVVCLYVNYYIVSVDIDVLRNFVQNVHNNNILLVSINMCTI